MSNQGEDDWDPDDYADLDGGEKPKRKPKLKVVTPIRPPDPGKEWTRGLRYGSQGALSKDPGNAALILANSPEWASLHFDDFAHRVRCDTFPVVPGLVAPTENEDLNLFASQWLAKNWHQTFAKDAVRDALRYAARARPHRHQVRDYLNALAWDGVRRVETFLSVYLGADDTEINRAIGRMWLVSATARAHDPGAKVDHMLVLEGAQGARKTSALEALCGDAWFQPELADLRNKDSQVALCGKWIVCFDEMHALRSPDVLELAKNFLTRRIDKYRPPYGEHEIERARSCVFAGTTNSAQYLHDPTGNRRFWPVLVGAIDVAAIRRDRDQIWAEANEMRRGGVQWWPTPEVQALLVGVTENRTHQDTWSEMIASYISSIDWTSIELCLTHLGFERKDHQPRDLTRVAKILIELGWERYQDREGGRRCWRYRPKGSNT